MMTDPQKIQAEAAHIVLHAWVALYLSGEPIDAVPGGATFSRALEIQAGKLRDSALALTAALEKMRLANEKLALRMAEHKAFFAKYKTPE